MRQVRDPATARATCDRRGTIESLTAGISASTERHSLVHLRVAGSADVGLLLRRKGDARTARGRVCGYFLSVSLPRPQATDGTAIRHGYRGRPASPDAR